MTFHVPNSHRIRTGQMGSSPEFGNNGAFFLPPIKPLSKEKLGVIASDGAGWEHVSVSLQSRCPTWDEMNYVKAVFWDDEDCVVQFHPPLSEYVNEHPYCLHLWRPIGVDIQTPPAWLVGTVKGVSA